MSYPVELNREYLRLRYRRQKDKFIEHLGGQCSKCGEVENLEIDHIDPKQKSFAIGRLWPEALLPEVYEELKKCQLLCNPCHVEKSAIDNSGERGFKHGSMYGWMKKKCMCDLCHASRRKFHEKRNAQRRKKH